MTLKIKIGHGAYTGSNALTVVNSKAAAVRELRNRGFLRNRARDIINKVCSIQYGYACEYVSERFSSDQTEVSILTV